MIFLNNFQAPQNRGKIIKLNEDQTFLLLSECENPGNYSNCNLRVLGQLEANKYKIDFQIKIPGVLKEFGFIENDLVIVLTNDNRMLVFRIGLTGVQEQLCELGSILPPNSASKLCNLHVCPKSKLVGVSVCTTKAIGMDPVFEKIMLFCINKKQIEGAVQGKYRIELKKLYHMELKLFAKPTILQYCIPYYKGDMAVMLTAEQSGMSTKFSLHGFDLEKKVRLGDEKHIDHRDLQCLLVQYNSDSGSRVFGLTSNGNLHVVGIKF